MKKSLLILPIFALSLSGCDLLSIFKKEENPIIKDDVDDDHDDDHDDDDHDDDNPVSITNITLDKKALSLVEGESAVLSYTILPTNATNKTVEWSTSNSLIATIEDGTVKAWKEGFATITVTALDGSKKDTCEVTVTKAKPVQKEIETKFDLSAQSYPDSYHNKSLTNMPLECNGEYTITFAVGANTYNNQPALIKTEKTFEARIYWGNTFTVTSKTVDMVKIKFSFTTNDSGNATTVSAGSLLGDTWTGSSKSVTFTVGGNSGSRAISSFSFFYVGESDDDPDTVVNLGEMSVSQVKTYIAEHPVTKNAFGNGVNEKRYVTIKGFALAKIDLIKTTAAFGLDVSQRGKVIIGDNTGVIACASETSSQGTCLWGKIGDHICKDTSKYIVTGYISEYLGHPEILVKSFKWDSTLDISINYSNFATEISTLSDLYQSATEINYNCAGHGYGDVVSVKNLYCFNRETEGSGIRFFNMTDGVNNIRVLCYNIGDYSVGSYYDVTGIVSLKDYSCAIYAFSVKSATSPSFTFNYESACTDITIADLRKIKGSQNDTSTKYPDLINNFSKFYKTTGYLRFVEENGKLYIGISDTYSKTFVSGKTKALSEGVALIRNDDTFWNIDMLEDFKSLEYINETNFYFREEKITVYYVPRSISYEEGKVGWTIYAIPESIESMLNEVE